MIKQRPSAGRAVVCGASGSNLRGPRRACGMAAGGWGAAGIWEEGAMDLAVLARTTLLDSALLRVGMALTSKCLAQNNKTHGDAR